MKKVLFVLLAIVFLILVAFGLFYFLGGKETVSNFFNEESDFGSFFDIDTQSQNDFEFTPPEVEEVPFVASEYNAPTLRQISFEPVSGYTYYATTSTSTRQSITIEQQNVIEEFVATSTVVRFQERATGHVYDVFEFQSIAEKVSNITVQKVYNTLFTSNKNAFLYQLPTLNNEQIKTVFARIIPSQVIASTTEVIPQRLEQKDVSNIIQNTVYIKETNSIAYSVTKPNGADIYTSDPERISEKKIASLPFNQFTLDIVNQNTLLVQTKASAGSVGYSYTLNLTTGSLNKFAGNTRGLITKMSPDLSYYLSSESSISRPILRAHDIESNTVRRIGLDTIPEKCAFSQVNSYELYCFGSLQYKAATYPDDWYKGKVFNTEDIYRIDLQDGLVEVIYVFTEDQEVEFDAIKVQVTNNDNFILFVNKYDLTLWSVDLKDLESSY